MSVPSSWLRSRGTFAWHFILKLLGFSEDTTLIQFIKTVSSAVIIAVGIRTWGVEPFKIPSPSMHPTLIEGDFLLVNKWAYGYSRFSFPFKIKLFEGRIGFRPPQRGDVVVFHPPHRPLDADCWIKRVVGVPGDVVQMKQGVLHLNGQPVRMQKQEEYTLEMWDDPLPSRKVAHYQETFPNLHDHHVIYDGPLGDHPLDNTEPVVVPEDHYFMMGDNRHHSADSRLLGGLGFVPSEYLVGKASLIFFSTDAHLWQVWRWLSALRYKRLFRWIQ